MVREVVTPCLHGWRFVQTVRIAHKGHTRSSETLRYRYACQRCTSTDLRSAPRPPQALDDSRKKTPL